MTEDPDAPQRSPRRPRLPPAPPTEPAQPAKPAYTRYRTGPRLRGPKSAVKPSFSPVSRHADG